MTNEKKSDIIGFTTSAVFHIALFFLLSFVKFKEVEMPKPEVFESIELNVNEEGMLANFGTSKTGKGDEQPENNMGQTHTPTPPPTNSPSSKVESNFEIADNSPKSSSNPQTDKILTQNVEETEVLKSGTKEVEKPKVPENNTSGSGNSTANNEKAKPNNFATDFFKNSKNKNNSSEQGTGGKNGDQGAPNGDVNSKNMADYSYGKGNKGVGYDLAGRKHKTLAQPDDNSQSTGKVVVRIKVDRNGKVLSAQFQQKGSTATDPTLRRKSEDAAMKAVYNADPNAPEEQWGTMVFDYSVQ